jgi:EAL domain-containing protein (putative c-di-GMP-specific phosphodiesterase class I)
VVTALSQSGLPAQNLELEVTESVLLKDTEENLSLLHELRDLGVAVALDDFGTGFSSLSYLHRFPFNKLKIDHSFIAGVVDRDESKAIIHAAVSLGHALGITITAEGVENSAQVTALKEIGCDEAQGYFFDKPVGPERAQMLIDKQWPDTMTRPPSMALRLPRLASAS